MKRIQRFSLVWPPKAFIYFYIYRKDGEKIELVIEKERKKKLNVNNGIPVFPSICKSFGIIGLIFQLLELNWSTKKVKKTKKQLGRKIFVARGYIFIFLIPFQVGGNLFRPHSATLQLRYHHVTHSR